MAEIHDIKDKRYEKIAEEFVTIYEQDKLKASEYAQEQVTEEEYETLRGFITAEFTRRGYVFEEGDGE